MKLRNLLLILSVLALLVVAGCSKPLAGQAINFGGETYSTEGCPQGEWWYELSDGTLLGEGRGGIVGCTTYNSQGQEGAENPWCGTGIVEKDGKQVYVSGGEWKWCEKEREGSAESAMEESAATGRASSRGESSEEEMAEEGTGYGGNEAVACSDSDNGLNYDVKGTLTNSDGETYEDFCSLGSVDSAGAGVKKDSSDYVYEYYCMSEQKAGTKIEKCDGGCVDGKCVSKKNVSCLGGTFCDGTPVTGKDGQVVCGTDLQNWTCTASGWQGTGQKCVCFTPVKTIKCEGIEAKTYLSTIEGDIKIIKIDGCKSANHCKDGVGCVEEPVGPVKACSVGPTGKKACLSGKYGGIIYGEEVVNASCGITYKADQWGSYDYNVYNSCGNPTYDENTSALCLPDKGCCINTPVKFSQTCQGNVAINQTISTCTGEVKTNKKDCTTFLKWGEKTTCVTPKANMTEANCFICGKPLCKKVGDGDKYAPIGLIDTPYGSGSCAADMYPKGAWVDTGEKVVC